MTGEQIFGVIINVMCGWGCAATFYGIGIWASKRKDPMHFWTGSTVDSARVLDIAAYNQANAKMWKRFSVPFWLMGASSIVSIFYPWANVLAIVFCVGGCTAGIGWLIHTYRKIEKRYIVQ